MQNCDVQPAATGAVNVAYGELSSNQLLLDMRTVISLTTAQIAAIEESFLSPPWTPLRSLY